MHHHRSASVSECIDNPMRRVRRPRDCSQRDPRARGLSFDEICRQEQRRGPKSGRTCASYPQPGPLTLAWRPTPMHVPHLAGVVKPCVWFEDQEYGSGSYSQPRDCQLGGSTCCLAGGSEHEEGLEHIMEAVVERRASRGRLACFAAPLYQLA